MTVGEIREIAEALHMHVPTIISPEFVRAVGAEWRRINAELADARAEIAALRARLGI